MLRWGTPAGSLLDTDVHGTPTKKGTCEGPFRVNLLNAKGALGRGAKAKLAPALEDGHALCPEIKQAHITGLVELQNYGGSNEACELLHKRLAPGRASYWTKYVGAVLSPSMLDVDVTAVARQGGRVLHLSFEWDGLPTHVIIVYGPGDTEDRVSFYSELWLPANGDTVIVAGDFNTVDDVEVDIRHGRLDAPKVRDYGYEQRVNPGGREWSDLAAAVGLCDAKTVAGCTAIELTYEGPHAWGDERNRAKRLDRIYVTGGLHVQQWRTVPPWVLDCSLDHALVTCVVARDLAPLPEDTAPRMRECVLDHRNTPYLQNCNKAIRNRTRQLERERPEQRLDALGEVIGEMQGMYEECAKSYDAAQRAEVKAARKAARKANAVHSPPGTPPSEPRGTGGGGAVTPTRCGVHVPVPRSPPGTPPTEPGGESLRSERQRVHRLVAEAVQRLTLEMEATEDAFSMDHDTLGNRDFYRRRLRCRRTVTFTEQVLATHECDEQQPTPGMAWCGHGGFADGADPDDWSEGSMAYLLEPVLCDADGMVRGDANIRINTLNFYKWRFRKRRDHRPSQRRLLQYAREAPHFTKQAVEKLGALVTQAEVRMAIQKLRTGRAPGPDGVTSECLQGLPALPELLQMVFNAAFEVGRLPDAMRQGTIVLLHKKGSRAECGNMRPLSLLSRFYLVLANIMTARLDKYLHQVIHQDQTAFVPGRQMHENLVKLQDQLQWAHDFDMPTAMVSVDMRAAYDCVSFDAMFALLDIACDTRSACAASGGAACDHAPGEVPFIAPAPSGEVDVQAGPGHGPAPAPPLPELEEGQMCGLANAPRARFTMWVRLLTLGAERRVLVNGELTDRFELGAGVPQGSSLSPALFTVFCNSLGTMLHLNLEGVHLPPTPEESAAATAAGEAAVPAQPVGAEHPPLADVADVPWEVERDENMFALRCEMYGETWATAAAEAHRLGLRPPPKPAPEPRPGASTVVCSSAPPGGAAGNGPAPPQANEYMLPSQCAARRALYGDGWAMAAEEARRRGLPAPPTPPTAVRRARARKPRSRHRMPAVRFADDVNLFLQVHEVSLCFDIIECWCQGCSMGLNAAKSIGMWAGSLRERDQPWRAGLRETPGYSCWEGDAPAPGEPAPRCRWVRSGGSMRVLGVPLGYHVDYDKMWQEVGTKMLTAMRLWGRLKLSLPARVMVLKTMVFSRAWFLASYCPLHEATLLLVRKAGLLFLHRGMLPAGITVATPLGEIRVPTAFSYPHVSARLDEGGLGMWDPIEQIRVLHAKWCWLLLKPAVPVEHDVASWQHLPRHYMAWHTSIHDVRSRGVGALVDGQACALQARVGSVLPPFWQRALRAWVQIRAAAKLRKPQMIEHVLPCSLWDNVLVTGARGPLEPPPGWMCAGVRTVHDVWHVAEQRPKTASEVRAAAPPACRECIKQRVLDGIVQCIPPEWLEMLRGPPAPLEDGEWVQVGVPDAAGVLQGYGVYHVDRKGRLEQHVWAASERCWTGGAIFEPEQLCMEHLYRVQVKTRPDGSVHHVVGFTHQTWDAMAERLSWGGHPYVTKEVRRAAEGKRPTMPLPALQVAEAMQMATQLCEGHMTESAQVRGSVWQWLLRAVWKAAWPPAVRDDVWRLTAGAAYFGGYRHHFDVSTALCKQCKAAGRMHYDTPYHAYRECAALGPVWAWAQGMLELMGYVGHNRDTFMLYGALAPTEARPAQYAHQLVCGHPVQAVWGAMAAGFARMRAAVNKPPPEGEPRPPPPHGDMARWVADGVLRRVVEMDFLEATGQIIHRQVREQRDCKDIERAPRPECAGDFDAKWVLIARVRSRTRGRQVRHKLVYERAARREVLCGGATAKGALLGVAVDGTPCRARSGAADMTADDGGGWSDESDAEADE